MFVVDTLASGYLRYHSFKFHRISLLQSLATFPLRPVIFFTAHCSPARTLTYWHRPHTAKTRLPVLFIHGIGVGLYPYIRFLADLNAGNGDDALDGQLGIIAIEIMPVSNRITGEALLKDKVCGGGLLYIGGAWLGQGCFGVTLVGFYPFLLLRLSSLLIDVCMKLWERNRNTSPSIPYRPHRRSDPSCLLTPYHFYCIFQM